jgi:hypothetical protein
VVQESVPTSEPGAHKRRSTRIVQAVPLTVAGVDALGRPFQERTSTLIINCHGCRYQSKHYVLKNMWVTMEVPHQEPGHVARTVRGRVMWIQRPRTVRELFQIGVELEVTGNFWGIAFPPADWFPFPEGLAAVPSPAVLSTPSAPPAQAPWPTPISASTEQVRMLGLAPSIDSSAASQVSQLVDDAKLELRAAVRQSAAEAVSLEARPLIASLELQLRGAAEKSLEAAAGPAAAKAFQEAKQAQVDAFLQECNRSMGQNMERVVQQLASRLEELERERSASFEQHLEKRVQERLEQLQIQAGELRPPPSAEGGIGIQVDSALIPSVQELEQRIRGQVEQAHATLSDVESAAGRLQEQAAAALSSAQSDWKARVEGDISAATDRWNHQVESSMASAMQQAGERLARNAQLAGEQAERDLALRIGEARKALDGVAQESENRLDDLRVSLTHENERAQESMRQLQSVENRIEDQAAQLSGLAHTAEQALEQRATALLDAQSQEMARRAEAAIATWAERLQPALEAAGQQTVTLLAGQLKDELHSRVESAAQMLARLESSIGSAEETMNIRQESMAKASEEAAQMAYERVKDLVSALHSELQESGRAATEKCLADIEAKATDTTHSTFESLFKTAEWYEKKVQTQMQAAIDKGTEYALGTLKEKAREMSGIFGAELDHYSRSYVEHTQEQVEDTSRESLERLRKQAEEIATGAAASIVQQARVDTEATIAEVRAKAEVDSQQLSREFRAALKLQTQDELGGARKEMIAQVGIAREELSLEVQTQQKNMAEALAGLNDEAIEDYKKRLESASNSWLLTTVSKLNLRSEQHLQTLTHSAEERLRDACNEVFNGIGENLRSRLLHLTLNPGTPPKTDE